MQPTGRTTRNSSPIGQAEELDWKRLCKPGPSGLFTVLVSLVWWRNMAQCGDAQDWEKAVEDVTWAMVEMEGLLTLPVKNTGKRK